MEAQLVSQKQDLRRSRMELAAAQEVRRGAPAAGLLQEPARRGPGGGVRRAGEASATSRGSTALPPPLPPTSSPSLPLPPAPPSSCGPCRRRARRASRRSATRRSCWRWKLTRRRRPTTCSRPAPSTPRCSRRRAPPPRPRPPHVARLPARAPPTCLHRTTAPRLADPMSLPAPLFLLPPPPPFDLRALPAAPLVLPCSWQTPRPPSRRPFAPPPTSSARLTK